MSFAGNGCAATSGIRNEEIIDSAFQSMEAAMTMMALDVQTMDFRTSPRPCDRSNIYRARSLSCNDITQSPRQVHGSPPPVPRSMTFPVDSCIAPSTSSTCGSSTPVTSSKSAPILPLNCRVLERVASTRNIRVYTRTNSQFSNPKSPPKLPPNYIEMDLKRRWELGKELIKATRDGRATAIQKLLSVGADPNFSYSRAWTPLHMAAWMAYPDIVLLLLENGANLHARAKYGFTALHMAAHRDPTGQCVSLLTETNNDVNIRDQYGRTPLHYAAACGNTVAVRALIDAGASKFITNRLGQTAFDVAATDYIARYIEPCL